MRIEQVSISQIEFQQCIYDEKLYASLIRVGLNFPIRVRKKKHGYVCSDGNKRLSAISAILKENTDDSRFKNIPVIIEEQARTAAPYSMHNHH